MALNRSALEQLSLEEHKKKQSTERPTAHTDKTPAEVTNKEIRRLMKHCCHIKQQLKTQMTVFTPEENGFPSPSPNVKIVQVNEKAERRRAFNSRIPVKEVTLELQHKDYLMGRDGTWHAHLDIHRMTQLDDHRVPKGATTENQKSSQKNQIPASRQVPPSKPTSIERPIYCPFPREKRQRISEVARRLRLYE